MSKGKAAAGVVFGAIAGFVTGILIAPKSGKETRQDIKDVATKTKDTAAEKAGEVKDLAEKKARQVKGKAEEFIGEAADKANELKGRTEQAVAGAKKGFSKKPTTKKK